ncbi:MAG: complex I NDUFA9 subunit family protein [Deltaproteobacteria bacterium]|nr:complex I NDUFA9 subunit family protein [Deltaproteobacteria bacterium]
MKIAGRFPHHRYMTYSAFMDFREILVTGGTGFVGTHVCRALIARGFLPRLLVRPGSEDRIPADIRERGRFTLGDVTDREAVEYAMQGTTAVVHLVGIIREFPEKGITFERLHVAATRNVVDAARRWNLSRIVHMSALGAKAGGTTGYFDSKGRAEEYVRRSGLSWTILRPSVIFGPGDQFINELARLLRIAPFLPVPGNGEYLMQPVFVGDVAKGFADSFLRPETEGRSFDVGGPERLSYNELLDRVAAGKGRRARKVHVPLSILRPVVRRMQRYGKFPLTTDQLEMLLAGNVCDSGPFYSAYDFAPFPLSGYLSGTPISATGSEGNKLPTAANV